MIHPYVDAYIEQYEQGKILFNKERVLLVEYIKREIVPRLESGEIYFQDDQIESCIGYIERWFFKLEDFQKFIICFVFLMWSHNDLHVYKRFLIMMGRGGGKNGLISGLSSYLLTPMHGIANYNVSIVANSEDQAKTSFDEVYNTIEEKEKLKKLFYNTKSVIRNKQTKSELKYRTSNGNTKDGLRDGAVVFDEIHEFQDDKDVRVHRSGLGKVKNPREFYITTDGYVREGFLDKKKEECLNVLTGKAKKFNSWFPFICKLDNEEEVDDKVKWQKSQPMFHPPMSPYAENLLETVTDDYDELEEDPSGREEFMTKRMNLPVVDVERSVASFEELRATKRDFPDLTYKPCIGGLDFASVRDFAAVGLLFKAGEDYIWLSHSFVRKGFVDKYYKYSSRLDERTGGANGRQKTVAPIRKWEMNGWLTVVDEPTINPQLIVDWFVSMRDEYSFDLQRIISDNFRIDVLRQYFEREDFEVSFSNKFESAPAGYQVEVLRNAKASDSLLAPRIETAFAQSHVNFGDNDMMRWYTNNVLRRLKSDGNVEYIKKEDVRRKIDGFKAFQYAMYRADDLNEVNLDYDEMYEDILDWY